MFLAFAVALRKGVLGDRKPASGQTIESTLQQCAKIIHGWGFKDPRHRIAGEHKLDPSISGFIKCCKDGDPAPERQLALPATTVRSLFTVWHNAPSTKDQITAALVVAAFFFLLRVGEYNPNRGKRPKRTVALRRCDVKL